VTSVTRKAALLPPLALALVACGGGTDHAAGTSAATGANAWLVELQQRPEYRRACEETPGCIEAERPFEGPQEIIWRVQVIREASGKVSIGRIDAVAVPREDGVPPGRATGDYLLVGVDGAGAPVDGQMIMFPRVLRVEYQDRKQAPREINLKGKRVDTIGYVRSMATIGKFEVQDADGKAIASAAAPPVPDFAATSTRHWSFDLFSSAYALTNLPGLPPQCAQVRILQGEADRDYASTLALTGDIAPLEVPGPFQLAAVEAALNRMTPLLCGAVGRIGFARFEAMKKRAVGVVMQAGEGESITINSASFPESKFEEQSDPLEQINVRWRRLQLQAAVLHESGHSAEALLNASGADPGLYGGDWQVPARTRAVATLANARLRKGFGAEWQRVHNSFVSVEWARAHSISGFAVPEIDNRVVSGGFMTSYGSNIWWDDIAEFVSQIYMGPVFRKEGFPSGDLACLAMQAWNEPNVPSQLAAVYTKALFLRDLGLVKPEDVAACVGTHLGLQSMPQGLHFWLDGQHYRSFTKNLKAGIQTESIAGNRVFTLEGEGEAGFGGDTYPAKLTLRLDLRSLFKDLEEVSWPRGVYKLGLTGDNNVRFVLDGAPAGNFDAMDGFVLVSEASNKRIAGSIVLQRVFRLQAPLPVPEKYDPPLIVRFKLEK
jgi:hypothetical protein